MGFLDLPLEIKLKILSCLPQKDILRASRVCRSFRDAAYHPDLWKAVKIPGECSRGQFVDSFASFALRVGSKLEELDVKLNNSEDSQRLFTALPQLPKLMTLKLRLLEETNDWVVESITRSALIRFGNIESLQLLLDGKYRIRLEIPKLKFLKHLKIQCMELNDIIPLLEECYHLETISAKSLKFFFPESRIITHFTPFYRSLTTVELTNVSINGEHLACLENCTGLTMLRILCFGNLEDDHFMVLDCFRCLITLDLAVLGRTFIEKATILQLFSGSAMKNLKKLYLPWMPVDDECVRSIALCCSNLETVSLLFQGDREICRSILKDCERLKDVFILPGF